MWLDEDVVVGVVLGIVVLLVIFFGLKKVLVAALAFFDLLLIAGLLGIFVSPILGLVVGITSVLGGAVLVAARRRKRKMEERREEELRKLWEEERLRKLIESRAPSSGSSSSPISSR